MVVHNSYPNYFMPFLVQINFKNGNIAFYKSYDGMDNYQGNLVAVFKCKPKKEMMNYVKQ